MTEENKENCNFQQTYNVFGLDEKPCCYLYHKYCEEINNCYFKRCKRLEQENKDLKKQIRLYDCIDKWGTKQCHCACRCLGNEFCEDADKKINTYRSALEKIKKMVTNPYSGKPRDVLDIINEVLNEG